MINLEISGKIPTLEGFTFSSSYEKIAKQLEISLKRNFAEGGRPIVWAVKKNGEPSHLFLGGTLFNTITSGFSEKEAWAGLPSATNPIYARVHQYGFRGVKSNGVQMNMPQREFILFQEEDIQMIRQELAGSIIDFFATNAIKI